MNVKAQQSSIEELLTHKLSGDRFRQLVNIGMKITDFKSEMEIGGDVDGAASGAGAAGGAAAEGALDENLGVSVVFGEDEEAEGDEDGEGDHRGRGTRDHLDEDDDEDDDEEDADEAAAAAMELDDGPAFKIERNGAAAAAAKSGKLAASALLDEAEELDNELDARTIDAHWIQRQVASFTKDPHAAQKLASDIFTQLSSSASDAECESALVTGILGFEQFTLIKLLLRNRWKIVYCIRLLQLGSDAESEKQRAALRAEMAADPKLRSILVGLGKTTTSAADKNLDLEKTLMREARNLEAKQRAAAAAANGDAMDDAKDAAALPAADKTTDAFWSRRTKALIDLDSLTFAGGGHFMSNAEYDPYEHMGRAVDSTRLQWLVVVCGWPAGVSFAGELHSSSCSPVQSPACSRVCTVC